MSGRSPRSIERLLLLPFPRRFRRRHGADLLELYRDVYGGPGRGHLRFLARSGWDALVHGLAARRSGAAGHRPTARRSAAAGHRPTTRRSGAAGHEPTTRRRAAAGHGSTTRPTGAPALPGGPGSGDHRAGWRARRMVQELVLDLRQGARVLRRTPGTTCLAVLVVALAVGATTSTFGVVHGVLLDALPFPEPDRLVRIYGTDLERGSVYGQVSLPDVADLAARSDTLEAVSPVDSSAPVLHHDGTVQRLRGRRVGAAYLEILGVEPLLGRRFRPDDEGPDAPPTLLLSHGAWQRRFGADPAVVGTEVDLGGRLHTIVGVLPPHLDAARLSFEERDVEIYLPWRRTVDDWPRSGRSTAAVGRLRPGASLQAARDEVGAIAAALAAEYPADNAGEGMMLVPLAEAMAGDLGEPLGILMGAVALVLLAGCANVASMLLASATGRRREIAVRAALGAGRGRLVRQVLAESLLLAGVGGGTGVVLSLATHGVLVAVGDSVLPRAPSFPLDPRVLGVAVAATLTTCVLAGFAPALVAFRNDLEGTLRSSDERGGARSRGLDALVVAEIALAVVLLVGAGLLLRSLLRLTAVDPGFDATGVVAAEIYPVGAAYAENAARDALYRGLEAGLEALPGAQAAGLVNILPLSGGFSCDGFWPGDRPPPAPGEGRCAETRAVAGSYFDAMGIPVLAGRAPDDRDTADAAPVAVVSESLARATWPGESALGKSLTSVHGGQPREVVGVVGDVRHFGLDVEPPQQLYLPVRQDPWGWVVLYAVVRSDTAASALVAPVRDAVAAAGPEIAIADVRPMAERVGDSVAGERLRTGLLAGFAAAALLMAATGLHGLMATTVSRRRFEIGLRACLGASPRRLLAEVMAAGLRRVVAGLAVGLALATAAAGALSSLLHEVEPRDPLTFGAVVAVLGVVAVAGCALPAARAAGLDPARVLGGR